MALPYGSPYVKSHANYQYVLNGEYNGKQYETLSALRVGWEPEVSPFNKDFDRTFLKRCRAYDNNGKEFDINMVFNSMLPKSRYVSDGNKDMIVTSISNKDLISLFNPSEYFSSDFKHNSNFLFFSFSLLYRSNISSNASISSFLPLRIDDL